ncbi:MAG: T9SS type A sorting domain-containing protein [Parabacteroides sp.]
MTNLDSETFFTGWYEDDVCLSKEQTLTIQVKDGSKTRVIRPRFEGKTITYSNTTITDANKVDGQDVTLYSGVTVSGSTTWKPASVALRRGASVLIDSPIETSMVTLEDGDQQYGWRYIALPYDLPVSEIIPYGESSTIQFVVRYYDGAARAQNGIGASWKQLKSTDKLEANKGYIIQSNTWGGFKYNASTGMNQLLNRSSVTVPLQKYTSVAAADANWNFIGNPFPCYYNIGTLFDNGFKGTITVWDAQLNNYQYYTKDDVDPYLAPLTSFFVQQTDDVSSILFTPGGRAAKLPDGTPRSASALRSGESRQVINLVLANDSLSDKTRIVFNEEASADYELGLDAAKFRSMNPNAPAFYTIDKDNQQLAINERPTGNGVVRLGCNFGVAGSYRIAAQSALANDLILTDHVTGAQTNLKESAYSFTAEAGETNDRFEVRGGNPTGIETIAGLQWNVRSGQLFLQGLPDGARVTVHDTMGRTVCDRMATGDLSGIALPQAGVYYLTITTRQGKFTERLMINE